MATSSWGSLSRWPAPAKKKVKPIPEPLPRLPALFESKDLWNVADPYFLARAANGTEDFLFRYPKHQSKDEYRQAFASVAEATAMGASKYGGFWAEAVVPVEAGHWAKMRGYQGSSTIIFPKLIHSEMLGAIMYLGSQIDTLPAGSLVHILSASKDLLITNFSIPQWGEVKLMFDGQSWMAGDSGQIQLEDQIIMQPSLRHFIQCARIGVKLSEHKLIPGSPAHAVREGTPFSVSFPTHSGGLLEISRDNHSLQVNRKSHGEVYFAQDSRLLPEVVEEVWVRHMFNDHQVSLAAVRQAFEDCLDASRLPVAG